MAVGLQFELLLRSVVWCFKVKAEVHRVSCLSEAKAGGLQSPGMFSFPAHHSQVAAASWPSPQPVARLTMYPSYTHTHTHFTDTTGHQKNTTNTRTGTTHTNSTCINKLYKWSDLFICVGWSHARKPLVAGHKLWIPQRLPLRDLTLPLEAGLDVRPWLPNPLFSPVSHPQTYGLCLSDLWSYPSAILDWSSLASHTQRTERTFNQENN